MNDEIGLFSHKRITAQYAFKRRLFGGMLSIGVQGGLLNETFDGGKVDLDMADDPAFTKSDITGNALDLGGGIYYSHRSGWYVGASVQHALAPVIELGETILFPQGAALGYRQIALSGRLRWWYLCG